MSAQTAATSVNCQQTHSGDVCCFLQAAISLQPFGASVSTPFVSEELNDVARAQSSKTPNLQDCEGSGVDSPKKAKELDEGATLSAGRSKNNICARLQNPQGTATLA